MEMIYLMISTWLVVAVTVDGFEIQWTVFFQSLVSRDDAMDLIPVKPPFESG